jgi:2-dehydropantoate 2-reductase
MKANGLIHKEADGSTLTVRPGVTVDPKQLGVQDFVILTLKSHAISGVLDQIAPLIGKDTAILFGQNGVPWWYFYGHGGRFDGRTIESVDPGGEIWRRLGPERALGCVIWQAAEIKAPGVVAHVYGERMPLGEPSGEMSDRAKTLSRLLTAAGLKSPVRPNLRQEIWLKLWGNLSFNPVSVLTGGTLAGLAGDAGTRRVIGTMMEEARAVATTLDISFAVGIEERMDMAAKVGAHRTSMLQDVEAGRDPEIDAIVGAVRELGRLVDIATPHIDAVYALVKLLGRTIQQERVCVRARSLGA